MSNPNTKYLYHKHTANKRGIPFLLTFEEWWSIWQQSGHWEERGIKSHQYVMSRYGDKGPYAVGNVFIQTKGENSSQHQKGRTMSQDSKDKKSKALFGKPWSDARRLAHIIKHL